MMRGNIALPSRLANCVADAHEIRRIDEYHTSFDTLGTVVTPRGLAGGFNLVQKVSKYLKIIFHQKQWYCASQTWGNEGYIQRSVKMEWMKR